MSLALFAAFLIAQPMNPASASGQTLENLAQAIPRTAGAYECVHEATYDRETVFDYLDGGAEIYLTYDFQAVLGRRYVKSGGAEILFDLFDMGRAEDAFGIFAQERESEEEGVGQGSEYTPGLLRFWKNRFFVSVTATELTEGATEALMGLGRAAGNAIIGEGSPPALLEVLPPEGLARNRVRYFHAFMALRQHYNLGWKDIVGLHGRADAVLAEYEASAGKSVVLVAKYPDEKMAEEGARGFVAQYAEEEATKSFARKEGKVWSLVERSGAFLVLVLEAPTREEAGRLADAVMTRWKEKHDE